LNAQNDSLIGENGDNIRNRKPPLLVMPRAADSFFLKDDKMVFRLVGHGVFFAHDAFLTATALFPDQVMGINVQNNNCIVENERSFVNRHPVIPA